MSKLQKKRYIFPWAKRRAGCGSRAVRGFRRRRLAKEGVMFLQDRASKHLVEILSLADLFNPTRTSVVGRYHYGEEAQDPEKFSKTALVFPSGEVLPRCWIDAHYRDVELRALG